MAVLTRSIQSGGGGDYTTIAAWEAAAPSLGTDIWKGEIDDDAEYNESVTFANSGTPSATSYYWLTGGTNNRHSGVAGTGHPRVRSTSGHVFNVQEDFTRVEWLEVEQDSGGSSDEGFRFDGADDVLVSYCIVYSGTPASDQDGFYCANNDSSITIDNCIVYGWNRAAVHFQNFGTGGVTQTLNLDHSTLHDPGSNGAVHIRSNAAGSNQTVNMHNNNGASVSGEPFADSSTGAPTGIPNGTVTWNGSHNLKDHSGTANIGGTNNLTDWQSATDGITDVSKTSGAWLVVDNLTSGSESYLLKDAEAGNLAVDNGTDRQGSEPDARQDFSVDITGESRPTTSVDIGAHEFAATGTALLKVQDETEQAPETDIISLLGLASLLATDTQTIADVVNENDNITDLHLSVDDDPATPDDNDWVNNAVVITSGASVFLDVTNLPVDFGNAETGTVTVRTRGVNVGATTLKLFARLYQSDETTPLSDEVEVASHAVNSAFTNSLAITFTGLNTTANKSVWDDARVRFRWGT